MSVSPRTELVLVQGLFFGPQLTRPGDADRVVMRRHSAFVKYAELLGVSAHEWLDGRGKALANYMLRLARGTLRPVDAVEIVTLAEDDLLAALRDETRRARWREVAACEPWGLDVSRSFILLGAPRELLANPGDGQRILWFGNGLRELSRAEFISHYTTRHGPLVAGHAAATGLKRYRQVPGERGEVCRCLRELGLGQAEAPAVFADLVLSAPSLKRIPDFRARRKVMREITADEKRHIDFRRSMLLLTGKEEAKLGIS